MAKPTRNHPQNTLHSVWTVGRYLSRYPVAGVAFGAIGTCCPNCPNHWLSSNTSKTSLPSISPKTATPVLLLGQPDNPPQSSALPCGRWARGAATAINVGRQRWQVATRALAPMSGPRLRLCIEVHPDTLAASRPDQMPIGQSALMCYF